MWKVLTLDFETHDPSIALKRGAGWTYKDFEVLGAACKLDDSPAVFTTNMKEVEHYVNNARTILCHNAQYDIGCLHRMGLGVRDQVIVDTAILARLYDNSMLSYSLDNLSSLWLGKNKDYAALEQAASALGIKKYMTHMKDLFASFPELVAQYARQDVELTYALSQYLKRELDQDTLALVPFYSDLIKSLVQSRAKGVRIDLAQAEKSDAALQALHDQYLAEFYEYCPGVNIESTKQLSSAFRELGLEPGTSEKGGDSVDSAWRARQTHPAVVALDKAKKYNKLRREFVEGIVERAENGRIYPEINILGAAETGRFSGSNPNIQQIPKRDPIATELIRSLILPEEGEKIYSLDFSSQEPRLQLHYAFQMGASGADLLRDAFKINTQHDLHQQVADLAGISRTQAKTINLGLSYGMGVDKLSASLKLDTKDARALLKKYKDLVPYLDQLNRTVKAAGERRGYIKTLLGRKLPITTAFSYKALNKLIQGGASDQTAMAMVQAYREGIQIMFPVHDELVLSTSNPNQALRLKEIMETVAGISIPCYTEILVGDNWGQTYPLK